MKPSDQFYFPDIEVAKYYRRMYWRKKLIWIRLIVSVLIGVFIVFGIASMFCL